MKRLAKTYMINIELELEIEQQQVVAQYMQHPQNINKKNRISEDLLIIMNDIIDSIICNAKSHMFIIEDKRMQSKKGCSYYVNMYRADINGNKIDDIKIRFRVSDHINMDIDNLPPESKLRIKSFIIRKT